MDIVADVTDVVRDLVPSRVVTLLTGVALVAALAACSAHPSRSATADAVSPPAIAAPSLTGDVAFPRTLQADRMVEVQVTGPDAAEWLVTSAALDSAAFAPLPPSDQNVKLREARPGRLRVPLGPATCPPGPGAASAVLTLRSPAGATAQTTVPLPTEVLEQINADECATAAVVAAAVPSLGEPESVSGTSVTTTLALTRGEALAAGAGAHVTDMRGSVIFTLAPAPGAALPLTLAPASATVTLPVVITATRCDQHAFAESKKTFVFAVWVALDGAEPAYVEIQPGPALRAALQGAFDACGEGTTRDAPGGA